MNDSKRRPLRVGLVGAGFMGRCHANAFRSVAGLFDLPMTPVLTMLADVSDKHAASAAAALGFARSTGDWRTLVSDPEIDLVSITAPNALHEPIAMAAIGAGKTVYCEKPLAGAEGAARLTQAAEAAGLTTLVGFNFLRNPMVRAARDIVRSGEIGTVTGFRGIHAEDYMASAEAAHSFRTDPAGGGALGDIGSHIIAMARYVVGPLVEVSGIQSTIVAARPERQGSDRLKPVEVDDRSVFLGRFASGVIGGFEANWAATGRKMQLEFEIVGTKGSLAFSQERMNELRLYEAGQAANRCGFKIIESAPAHPPYDRFCPAPGHHLGFNDLKVIEVAELIQGLSGGVPLFSDFREAWAVEETVEAVARSSLNRTWESVRLPDRSWNGGDAPAPHWSCA